MLALLVAACGQGGDSPAIGPAATFEGKTFVAQRLVVDGAERVPVTGTSVRFDEGQLWVGTGCNTASGPYRVEDGHLTVLELGLTEMACLDPAASEQEALVMELLQDRPAMTVDGSQLTLATESVRLEALEREVTDPDRALTGTTWAYAGLLDPTSASIGQLQATLVVEGSTYTVTGCRTTTGVVAALSDGTLQLTPLGTTGEPCETAAEEDRLLAALQGTLAVTIEGPSLTLKRADGHGAMFHAA